MFELTTAIKLTFLVILVVSLLTIDANSAWKKRKIKMNRKPMSNSSSKSNFKKAATPNKKNMQPQPMRGGRRL
jgi:hypothetical protein